MPVGCHGLTLIRLGNGKPPEFTNDPLSFSRCHERDEVKRQCGSTGKFLDFAKPSNYSGTLTFRAHRR